MIRFGYVILPTGVDRDKFISTSLNRERITILNDAGAPMKDCYISKSEVKNIIFPSTDKDIGSMVGYILTNKGQAVILSVISKEAESQLLKESEKNLESEYDGSSAGISVDAKKGIISLNVSKEDGTGTLIVSVTGNDGADIKVNCNGSTSVFSKDKVSIESTAEIEAKSIVSDASFVSVQLSGNKISVANELTSLNDIISGINDACKKITVPTPSGTSGIPINLAEFEAVSANIKLLMK